MDVLKQKLNDIGSCIGYPFYFFEDGSYSKSIVNGKMNAMVIVKKPFLSSQGSCLVYVTGDEAQKQQMREKWAHKEQENASFVSQTSKKLNWFKKNINDLGDCIGYPYYILGDGTCILDSDGRKKMAAVVVRKAFENIYGFGDLAALKVDGRIIPHVKSVDCGLDEVQKLTFPPKIDDDKTREIKEKILCSTSSISCGVCDEELLYMIQHGQIDAVKKYLIQGIADKTYNARCDKYFSRYYVFAEKFPKTIEEIVKIHNFELFKFFMADKSACYLCANAVYANGTLEMLEYILTDTGSIDVVSHPSILIEKNNVEGYRLFCKIKCKKHGNLFEEYYCLVRMMKYDLFKILLEEEFKYTGEFTQEMFANLVRIDNNCSTLINLITGKVSQEFLDMLR